MSYERVYDCEHAGTEGACVSRKALVLDRKEFDRLLDSSVCLSLLRLDQRQNMAAISDQMRAIIWKALRGSR